MPSSQELISIVVGVGIFLILIFYWRRFSGIQSSTRLYLKNNLQRKQLKQSNDVMVMSSSTLEVANEGGKTKNLNVLFMYNGHSFDAHEILGIPAGANLQMIDNAYQSTLKKVSPDSSEFIKTAYNALKSQLRN